MSYSVKRQRSFQLPAFLEGSPEQQPPGPAASTFVPEALAALPPRPARPGRPAGQASAWRPPARPEHSNPPRGSSGGHFDPIRNAWGSRQPTTGTKRPAPDAQQLAGDRPDPGLLAPSGEPSAAKRRKTPVKDTPEELARQAGSSGATEMPTTVRHLAEDYEAAGEPLAPDAPGPSSGPLHAAQAASGTPAPTGRKAPRGRNKKFQNPAERRADRILAGQSEDYATYDANGGRLCEQAWRRLERAETRMSIEVRQAAQALSRSMGRALDPGSSEDVEAISTTLMDPAWRLVPDRTRSVERVLEAWLQQKAATDAAESGQAAIPPPGNAA